MLIESPSCEDNFRLNHVRALGYTTDVREFRFHVVAADRGRLANLGDARVYDPT